MNRAGKSPDRGRPLESPRMPIYEFVCMECESHYEELVRMGEQADCPDCGSANVTTTRCAGTPPPSGVVITVAAAGAWR